MKTRKLFMPLFADERGVHFGNRCPRCAGRAITNWDKVLTMIHRHSFSLSCANCNARIKFSQLHFYGLSIALCVLLFVASYFVPNQRIEQTAAWHWIVLAIASIFAVVFFNWLFVRLVPPRLDE